MRNLIFFLSFVIPFICSSKAENPKWEPVRPSVFLILEGQELADVKHTYDGLKNVLSTASKYLTGHSDGIVHESIENIVVFEQKDGWLVAFFQKGNGRKSTSIRGEAHFDSTITLNPFVVRVTKKDFSAEKHKGYIALPWAIFSPVGVTANYPDKTPAEKLEYARSVDPEAEAKSAK